MASEVQHNWQRGQKTLTEGQHLVGGIVKNVEGLGALFTTYGWYYDGYSNRWRRDRTKAQPGLIAKIKSRYY